MSEYPFVLVLGGARSGKSRYAEALATNAAQTVTYVATAGPPRDDEMRARIAVHRARRPAGWVTLEVERAIGEPIRTAGGVVLLDCMTLWLTNVMLAECDIASEVDGLLEAIAARRGPVVAVSNEVGEGIVPQTSLGRAFRDEQGVLNQRLARSATTVVKMVAGYPLVVKPSSQPEISL
ncbi:bifunctional adenosylcobinamide kinase/adenosylcobinamide-phosphate guanylyltransferase [Acuticoccus kandeliae]|uniref:bifunctional adenosylcobinamide kinase/adenosylcobinamide-phosphate guanylyltransferase n=1 Tax=Acuticoccus kandeliae TaxID=2073160 RepID=UPI00196B3779|nr:bifunctional adenosylcobinamide kinase/adenosylcobinamide-phosphate guanylyltransferase [Acuticoccus kandeliae]